MKIEVSMSREEQRLEINSWWATGPAFALAAFRDQIETARILWPEAFAGVQLSIRAETAAEK